MPPPEDEHETSSADANPVLEAGWRQGSIVGVELAAEIARIHELEIDVERDRLAVISADCDVTAMDFEREPFVELLVIRDKETAAKDGSFMWGKNPRVLQFEEDRPNAGGVVLCEVAAKDAVRVDRSLLAEHAPDDTRALALTVKYLLSVWMSKRYHRAAFPEAFNQRLRAGSPAINKTLKREGAELTGLYLVLVGEELAAEVPYDVELLATVPADVYEATERRTAAQGVVDQVAAALDSCDGIEVLEASLRSEDDVNLSELKVLRRWDFDSLSLREDPPSDLSPLQI